MARRERENDGRGVAGPGSSRPARRPATRRRWSASSGTGSVVLVSASWTSRASGPGHGLIDALPGHVRRPTMVVAPFIPPPSRPEACRAPLPAQFRKKLRIAEWNLSYRPGNLRWWLCTHHSPLSNWAPMLCSSEGAINRPPRRHRWRFSWRICGERRRQQQRWFLPSPYSYHPSTHDGTGPCRWPTTPAMPRSRVVPAPATSGLSRPGLGKPRARPLRWGNCREMMSP
jgi:hypothetical protein